MEVTSLQGCYFQMGGLAYDNTPFCVSIFSKPIFTIIFLNTSSSSFFFTSTGLSFLFFFYFFYSFIFSSLKIVFLSFLLTDSSRSRISACIIQVASILNLLYELSQELLDLPSFLNCFSCLNCLCILSSSLGPLFPNFYNISQYGQILDNYNNFSFCLYPLYKDLYSSFFSLSLQRVSDHYCIYFLYLFYLNRLCWDLLFFLPS